MPNTYLSTFLLVSLMLAVPHMAASQDGGSSALLVIQHTEDFEVTGDGRADNWEDTDWIELPQRRPPEDRGETRLKLLYSDTGIYFLYYCEDDTLNATITEDFGPLFREDVVEAFLWPEQDFPVYFEYELSPLNYELPILVPNNDGRRRGWLPWNFEGDRRTRTATSVQGGPKESGAAIDSWMAEFFIPFQLLVPLEVPPTSGTTWQANFYRLDYDEGVQARWEWQPVNESFHEIEKYGTIRFE